MTKNQIEYLKLLETERSNKATEDINRSKVASDREIGLGQLAESKRHNLAGEQQQIAILGETQRHNVIGEQLQAQSISEVMRSNRAQESLQLKSQLENERSNRAREAETERTNRAREVETERSNRANEKEYNRSNLAREEETHRTNVANELIRNRGVDAQFAGVAAQYASIAETSKYHAATVALEGQRLSELSRSNKAAEREQHRTNVTREHETMRSNMAKESEATAARQQTNAIRRYEADTSRMQARTAQERQQVYQSETAEAERHNRANEGISIFTTAVNGVSNTARAVIPLAIGG